MLCPFDDQRDWIELLRDNASDDADAYLTN